MTRDTLVPRGPWSDRAEVERLLGPLRQTLEAPADRTWFRAWVERLLTGGGVVLLAGFGLALLGRETPWPELLGCGLGCGFPALIIAVAMSAEVQPRRPGGDVLLVGAAGLAEWRDGSATVLLWADLGVTWHALPHEFDEPAYRNDTVALLLEHDNGTRLRLCHAYPGVPALADDVREQLHRNQLARTEAILRGDLPAPEPEPVPHEEAWPALEPGPWADSELARAIGPVRLAATLLPSPRWLGMVVSGAGTGVVLLVLFAIGAWSVAAAAYGRPFTVIGLGLLLVGGVGLALLAWACLGTVRAHAPLLLVGERGMAGWDGTGKVPADVVLWDDLGVDWRACVEVRESEQRQQPGRILLKLQHADGARFYVTDACQHAVRIVAEVRRQLLLARHRTPATPSTRPEGIQRQPAVTATPPQEEAPPVLRAEPGPWAHSAAVQALGPVEFVCRSQVTTGFLEFITGLIALGGTVALAQRLFAGGFWDVAWIVPIVLALWAVAFGIHLLRRYLTPEEAWLVGEHGLAHCTDTGAVAIGWDELGTAWRVIFWDEDTQDANPATPLTFVRGDGRELSVTRAYRDVDRLLQRVREEIVRRLGPDSRMLRAISSL